MIVYIASDYVVDGTGSITVLMIMVHYVSPINYVYLY